MDLAIGAPKPRFPWARIAAEGAVIVVSILLAFAIDAWASERAERRQEQVHLQRLGADLQAMRAHVLELNANTARDVRALRELTSGIAAARATGDTAAIELGRRIGPRLVRFELFLAQLPTYSEMLSTGSLSLLTSKDVLARLGEFQTAAGGTAAWNRWAEQEALLSMQPYVLQNMPYQPMYGSAANGPDPSREPLAWAEDPRFWTLLAMRIETDEGMIANRKKLLEVVDSLERAVAAARVPAGG